MRVLSCAAMCPSRQPVGHGHIYLAAVARSQDRCRGRGVNLLLHRSNVGVGVDFWSPGQRNAGGPGVEVI